MKILMIKQKDMEEVFSMADAVQGDKDALAQYSAGTSIIPLRTKIDIVEENAQSLYMPGYEQESKSLGIKIVSVYPNNIDKGLNSVPATMVLQNSETGEVCAILDGTYLTRIRTGAVAGAATDILAKKDVKKFALFGAGGQAMTQLEAILCVRPNLEEVMVYDMDISRASAFVEEAKVKFGALFSVEFYAAETTAEAVTDADIITTVTTSTKPLFDGKLVKKGAHINGIGAYTPEMQELDEYIVQTADKIYVDTKDGTFAEKGDLLIPVNKKLYSLDKIKGELGEVILGKSEGRTSDDEITIFESVGTAVLDIVIAKKIYEKAIEKSMGEFVEF